MDGISSLNALCLSPYIAIPTANLTVSEALETVAEVAQDYSWADFHQIAPKGPVNNSALYYIDKNWLRLTQRRKGGVLRLARKHNSRLG